MANKLEVKDLRISFRTVSGKLKAVRDINFTLQDFNSGFRKQFRNIISDCHVIVNY